MSTKTQVRFRALIKLISKAVLLPFFKLRSYNNLLDARFTEVNLVLNERSKLSILVSCKDTEVKAIFLERSRLFTGLLLPLKYSSFELLVKSIPDNSL
ncbi:hypothetical protein D3C85_1579840 [compost metagenome]